MDTRCLTGVLLVTLMGGCSGSEADDPISRCANSVYDYQAHVYECWPAESTPPDRTQSEEVCSLEQSVWIDCPTQVDAFRECGEQVACGDWVETCWNEYLTMLSCMDVCGWPDDGECDEPEGTGYCNDGTDVNDCAGGGGGGSGDDSCQWAHDGVCDEPTYCEYGTDTTDCGGGGGGGSTCDPGYCSGCMYECSGDFCITCCYSCSGDTCQQTCT